MYFKKLFILLKSFKLIYDLVLFSFSIQLNSIVLCSNEQIGLLSGVFLSIVVAPIFLNTLVEFIVYLHKFWKRFLIALFCCELNVENKNDTKKDKEEKACVTLLFFLISIPLGLIYLMCYIFIVLIRLIDIRQCFWKVKYYYLNFILHFFIQSIGYIYSIIYLAFFIYVEKSCNINSSISIAILIMIILRYLKRSIYFFYFQYFVPCKLKVAQEEINKNRNQSIFSIGHNSNHNQNLSMISRKNILFFPKKYLFMPQFLRFMRMSEFGSMGCLASENCSSLDLEHIVLCHNELNIPNQNCRCCYDCTCRDEYLVGFHQTQYHPALSISLSPMRLTQDKDSWFGPGIYFARRFSDTKRKVGKNGGLGSLIVALVDMKRRKDVYRDADNTRDDLSNYDSIYVHRGFYKKPYLKPRTEKLYSLSDDEFLIFNENQIVQFIVCLGKDDDNQKK